MSKPLVGTKIKIGFSSSGGGNPISGAHFQPRRISATSSSSSSSHVTAESGITADVIAGTSARANMKLFDLCGGAFLLRKGRNKRSREAPIGASSEVVKPKAPQKIARPMSEPPKTGGPQVEIINGKIVIRESSLVVNQGGDLPPDLEEVEEGVHATATYSSFTRRVYSPPWGIEETRLFYQAMRQCGTDFSMMQVFFPGRTRLQLKRKFFREEKEHPELVKRALEHRLPIDMAPFELHMGNMATDAAPLIGTTPSSDDRAHFGASGDADEEEGLVEV